MLLVIQPETWLVWIFASEDWTCYLIYFHFIRETYQVIFTLICSICFLHLWFQLVQSNCYLFKELVGKVVRVGVWDYKIRRDTTPWIFFASSCASPTLLSSKWCNPSDTWGEYSPVAVWSKTFPIYQYCIYGTELESSAADFVMINNRCDTASRHADVFLSNHSGFCSTQPAWWSRVYMPNSVSCGAHLASLSLCSLTRSCLPIFQMKS